MSALAVNGLRSGVIGSDFTIGKKPWGKKRSHSKKPCDRIDLGPGRILQRDRFITFNNSIIYKSKY
jgi:hypothetical protein